MIDEAIQFAKKLIAQRFPYGGINRVDSLERIKEKHPSMKEADITQIWGEQFLFSNSFMNNTEDKDILLQKILQNLDMDALNFVIYAFEIKINKFYLENSPATILDLAYAKKTAVFLDGTSTITDQIAILECIATLKNAGFKTAVDVFKTQYAVKNIAAADLNVCLRRAASKGDTENVKILVKFKEVNINSFTEQKRTAFDLCEKTYPDCAKFLRSIGAMTHAELHSATVAPNPELNIENITQSFANISLSPGNPSNSNPIQGP